MNKGINLEFKFKLMFSKIIKSIEKFLVFKKNSIKSNISVIGMNQFIILSLFVSFLFGFILSYF